MRNKKLYKDILATSILLGLAGFIYGLCYFANHSTKHQKDMVIYGLVGLLICAAIFALWVMIRQIVD